MADTGVGQMEEAGRKHSGVVGIVQTVIGGLLLLIAANIWHGLDSANERAQHQAETISAMRETLDGMKSRLSDMQTQLGTMTQISASLARIETRLDGAERRINEIEQTKRLK